MVTVIPKVQGALADCLRTLLFFSGIEPSKIRTNDLRFLLPDGYAALVSCILRYSTGEWHLSRCSTQW